MNTAFMTIWAADIWGNGLSPWQTMVSLALAIYAVCKTATWWPARHRLGTCRSAAYLLAWPGMDPQPFFVREDLPLPSLRSAMTGTNNIVTGILLVTVASSSSVSVSLAFGPIVSGLMGLAGLVLVFHFGLFHLLALGWQRLGFGVQPIMNHPLWATSLADFWSRRWNLAFRDLSHQLIFKPLVSFTKPQSAMLAVFFVSGIIHDVVISIPAGAGYGLPTLYFLLQAVGWSVQRTRVLRRLGFTDGPIGWLTTAVVVLAPVRLLFHDAFLERVMLPLVESVNSTFIY